MLRTDLIIFTTPGIVSIIPSPISAPKDLSVSRISDKRRNEFPAV